MRTTRRDGPDTGTVRAARAGDPRALDDLVAASLPLVYNIVGRALNGHADTDDVVQETLLRVVRHLPELRDAGAYRSWLVAITVRQVRDHEQYRQAARTRRADLDVAQDVPDPASDFAALTILRLGLADQRREVVEATRWLDPDDRTLLALWWLEETGEIDRAGLVGALGLSGPHAAVRVQRMKDQLHAARTVVRALHARPGCRDLHELTRDWDGGPSPLWRKRLARHVRDCRRCAADAGGLLPAARLLAGTPPVPVPAALSSAVPHAAVTPAAAHVGITPAGAAHAGAHAAVAHQVALPLRVLRKVFALATHAPVTAGLAAAGVAAAVVIAVNVHGPEPERPAAAPASAPAAAPVVEPSSAAPAASPSPKPSAKPSTAPPAAPAAPVSTAKKGVSAWSFTGVNSALAQSGATWYYTWSTTHGGISAPAKVGFVPMIWGTASVTAGALAQARAAGPYLLSFNEPDMAAQSNMTPDQALKLWPQLMATGLTLGSPAVATGGDRAGGWLDRFMSGAKAKGYRVDFITLHWYGGDFVTDRAVSQLRSYIQAVYSRYHKPIWLTEYALINFSGGTSFPSEGQQAAFVTGSIKMLDSLSYVQRYAWFALPADDSKPSSGLFRSGPKITAAGKAFQAAR